MLANLKSHLYHHLDHYYRGFPHHQHWDHHRHNDHDHQEKLLAGRAFKKWKDHRPSFDEMHAEDLKRRPRSVFITIMVITLMVVINIINTIIIIYSAPDIAEYNYIQWDIIVFFPSVNVYQSMDSDHPDIQVNMLLYLAMTGVQIKRFLHFLSLCSCINCTIAVKNVPRITIEWTQRTFYLQLREGQGSLLISKLEFFIKADFQGLGFL